MNEILKLIVVDIMHDA